MTWLLVITILNGPNGDFIAPIGVIASEPLCQLIGNSLTARVLSEAPAAKVSFTCAKRVAA